MPLWQILMVLMSVLKDNRGAKDAESWDEEAEEAVEKAEVRREAMLSMVGRILGWAGGSVVKRYWGNRNLVSSWQT